MSSDPWFSALREWVAFKVAPWVYVPHRHQRDEAFKRLAEVAYGSRDAIWSSPTTLVRVALEHARTQARREYGEYDPAGITGLLLTEDANSQERQA